jgi:hypothetical protein
MLIIHARCLNGQKNSTDHRWNKNAGLRICRKWLAKIILCLPINKGKVPKFFFSKNTDTWKWGGRNTCKFLSTSFFGSVQSIIKMLDLLDTWLGERRQLETSGVHMQDKMLGGNCIILFHVAHSEVLTLNWCIGSDWLVVAINFFFFYFFPIYIFY